MEWFNNMINAFDYIEKNICYKVDYAQAARIAQCTLSRFQSIFLFITDVTLAEYVRRRKMALSAIDLLNSDVKVIELSLKYGYESPEAFTRSFKAFHGASPSDIRKSGEYIDYPPISFQITVTGGNYSMSSSLSKITVCQNTLIKYIDLSAVRFIGKDVLAKGKERGKKYGEMWDKSDEFMPVLDTMADYATIITEPCALMHHNNGAYNKNPMHYIVGKFMKASTPVPEGFDYWDIPKTKMAYAIFNGEFDAMINNAYKMTRDKVLADGWKIPYPGGYFHAEVYVKENIPQKGVVSRLGYLFACCSDEERETRGDQTPYPQ